MDFGVVILPDLDFEVALDRFREAEALGFACAWTYDHLSWRTLRDGPWFAALPLLSAIAASTTTLRIGTLVASPNFRHPVVLAKEAMTIDRLSAGRFELGLGAGGTGFDALALGGAPLSPARRAARFEEFVECLDLLLREPEACFEGAFYTAVESRTAPGCVQAPRVPFTIAAAGARSIALAARYGAGWVTYGPLDPDTTGDAWFAAVGEQVGRLDDAWNATGREAGSCRRYALAGLDASWSQQSLGAFDAFCGRLEELGFTDVLLHWPRDDTTLSGPSTAVFEEVCRRLC